jgi:predicted nucleotidyltransferase
MRTGRVADGRFLEIDTLFVSLKGVDGQHPLSLDELKGVFGPFCRKHRIGRLDVFGSAARGEATAESDLDLLIDFDDSVRVSTGELLEMAGEAEELAGAPVDFVLRRSLEKSANRLARESILKSAVTLYGS